MKIKLLVTFLLLCSVSLLSGCALYDYLDKKYPSENYHHPQYGGGYGGDYGGSHSRASSGGHSH